MTRSHSNVSEASAHTLGVPCLTAFFEQMTTIRTVEESLFRLYSEGLLHGTVHTCLGQEACAVGVVSGLNRDTDIIFSNHRCHGHYLAYCDDVEGLIAELMGRSTGVCAGVGGSQHLQRKNFYSNGIQGGIVPVATGMALAEKIQKTGAIAVVFLGDGTMGEGTVYESFNVASLWQIPILFVAEFNGYAQSTPTHMEHAGLLESRALSFDIPTESLQVSGVEEVYVAAQSAVALMRRDCRPRMLCLRTYRLGPHSKGDDVRNPEEIAPFRLSDPLLRLRRQLDETVCEKIETDVRKRVSQAVEAARAAPTATFRLLEASWPS